MIPVNNVDDSLLAGADDFVRERPTLLGRNQPRSRPQVKIEAVQRRLIVGCEVVQHGQATRGAQLQEAVTVVDAPDRIGVEGAVSSLQENVATRTGGETTTALPDASLRAVGRVIKDRYLLEC